MKYTLTNSPKISASDCLVIGFLEDRPFDENIQAINKACGNQLDKLCSQLKEKGDFLWQSDFQNGKLLLLHCGKTENFDAAALKKTMKTIYQQLQGQKLATASLALPALEKASADWQLEQMLLALDYQHYQLLDFKKKDTPANTLSEIAFYLPTAENSALKQANALAKGIKFCRDLANLPANICTPSYLADQARNLAETFDKISAEILDKATMEKMGMGALLAVAKGSCEAPYLIEMQYNGGGSQAPVVLVGKGITFDSGGISIKPAASMEEMKYDMGGAASVFGCMKACAELDLPINLIGLVPAAENMPSSGAVKPGDIVTSMSGLTIEVNNTDAEGRLVLADALTYAERFSPEFVIDIATLTGAMVIALGSVTTGYMTKDDALADSINQAAESSLDKAWRMPLDDEYQEAMNGNLADLVNAGADRTAGSITAACFLSRFTEKFRWAHMDIAGTAWISGKNNISTGRPVPLLVQLLKQVAHAR